MKTITVSNIKGGVGKTTISVFLAQSFATAYSKRVLVLDFDPQSNATDYFLPPDDPLPPAHSLPHKDGASLFPTPVSTPYAPSSPDSPSPYRRSGITAETVDACSILHFLTCNKALSDCVFPVGPNIDLVPATPNLIRIEHEIGSRANAFQRVVYRLAQANYDICIIDTSPALLWQTHLALGAADVILIPLYAQRWSLMAFRALEQEIHKDTELKPSPPVYKAVPSLVTPALDVQTRLSPVPLTHTSIFAHPVIRAASHRKVPLPTTSKAAAAFLSLATEVLSWL